MLCLQTNIMHKYANITKIDRSMQIKIKLERGGQFSYTESFYSALSVFCF
jgi:hypothetical protein